MEKYLWLVMAFGVLACRQPTSRLAQSNDAETLHETGLYDPQQPDRIASNTYAYQPRYQLWSDGAEKKRWVYIPQGKLIDTSLADQWVYPVGTKFWKEFSFGGIRVETRFIEKVDEGSDHYAWRFATYAWNPSQTEAVLVPRQGIRDAATTSFGTTHDIPSQTDCLTCHQSGSEPVLGFDHLQLAKDGMGLRAHDLNEKSLLTTPVSNDLDIPAPNEVAREALGYLHANCGNCHNSEARAGRLTGLIFKHDSSVISYEQLPVMTSAVDKLTKYYEVPGHTIGVDSFHVVSGDADASAVFLRMQMRVAGKQMPPLGTKVADTEGLNAVRAWIFGLGK